MSKIGPILMGIGMLFLVVAQSARLYRIYHPLPTEHTETTQ